MPGLCFMQSQDALASLAHKLFHFRPATTNQPYEK
jgi:hypothetical protein